MFEQVNLEKALRKVREERDAKLHQESTLEGFKSLFDAEWERDKRLQSTLGKGVTAADLLPAAHLDADRMYDLKDIRDLCLTYRLRFLSTKHFKKEFPREALERSKQTEAAAGQEIKAFMIAAPAPMFHLEDCNADPLLFAPLDNGKFYLIHKWGSDLSFFRKFIYWPFQKLGNLVLTIFAISLVLSAAIPTSAFSSFDLGYFNFYRVAFFVWNVAFMAGFTSYFWFATNQKFSVQAWNSKHFN
jgi:hypothetical protein